MKKTKCMKMAGILLLIVILACTSGCGSILPGIIIPGLIGIGSGESQADQMEKKENKKENKEDIKELNEENTEVPDSTPPVNEEDQYYAYLKDTYGTGESELVSAFMMDFDSDSRKDLLTVTKGRVILANTPLGAFDLYDGGTEASTLDLIMYQLDEKNSVVKTGAILGADTIEGHSQGKMSVSIILQDG